jgi:hypothetical protein
MLSVNDYQTVLGGWNPKASPAAAQNWLMLTPPITGVNTIGVAGIHYNLGYLPRSAGSAPSGLVSGDLWVDTTGGNNILKVV